MKKMYAGLFMIATIAFANCSKIDTENVVTAPTETDVITITKKIQSVEVRDDGVLKDEYRFTYKNDLLDSIIHQKRNASFIYTKLFYAGKSIMPSGYTEQTGEGPYPQILHAGFITEGRFITQKVLSNSTWYYYWYNDQNLLSGRTFAYPGYESVEIGQGNVYKNQNIDYSGLIGDYSQELTFNSYDKNPNPFHMQKNVLYYLNFNPFNKLKNQASEGYNLYDGIVLNNKNATKLTYVANESTFEINALNYAYDADGYPVKIVLNTLFYRDTDAHINKEVLNIKYY